MSQCEGQQLTAAAIPSFPTSEQLRHVPRGVLTHRAHYKHPRTPHGDLRTVLLQETLAKLSFSIPGVSAKVSIADLARSTCLSRNLTLPNAKLHNIDELYTERNSEGAPRHCSHVYQARHTKRR